MLSLRQNRLAGPIHPYADIVRRQREEDEEGSDEFVDAEENFREDEGGDGISDMPSGQNNGGAHNPNRADPISKQNFKQPNRGSSTTW